MTPLVGRRVAAVLFLAGLLLEIRGAYITASMFQPFTFRDFLGQIPRILAQSVFAFRPHRVLSPSYREALELKLALVGTQEATYLVAGLALLMAGIALQIVAGALMVWVEFQPPEAH